MRFFMMFFSPIELGRRSWDTWRACRHRGGAPWCRRRRGGEHWWILGREIQITQPTLQALSVKLQWQCCETKKVSLQAIVTIDFQYKNVLFGTKNCHCRRIVTTTGVTVTRACTNFSLLFFLQGDTDYVDITMRVAYIKSPPGWPYGANLIFKSTKYVSLSTFVTL